MKHNLTPKQKETVRWLVERVRNGTLTEGFEVRTAPVGKQGLELWSVPREGRQALEFPFTRGELDALDASQFVVTRIVEGNTSPGMSQAPTQEFESYRQCTLTGSAYRAVESDFAEDESVKSKAAGRVEPAKKRSSKKPPPIDEPPKHAKFIHLLTVGVTCISVSVGVVIWFYEKIRIPTLESKISFRDDRIKELEAKLPPDKKTSSEKLPVLQVESKDGSALDGRTVRLVLVEGHWTIPEIRVTNRGTRRTEPMTLSFSFATKINAEGLGWIETMSINPEFVTRLNLQSGASSIDSEEIYPLPPLTIRGGELSKPIVCQIEAFYGGEKALRTRFSIERP
jgi:hypothetical protein